MQLSTFDIAGGAEKIAWTLFQEYFKRGHTSWLVVGHKRSANHSVIEIKPRRFTLWALPFLVLAKLLSPFESIIPGVDLLRSLLHSISGGWSEIERCRGRENFNYPASKRLIDLIPKSPDIIHAHNLHGGYFDLRVLPKLSQQFSFVMTLHDAWLLAGHCAHSFDCERWKTGCGDCPDLSIYHAIKRDATAYNWRRKKEIYALSRLYIATPSSWLMDKVKQSILSPAIVDSRVIPNGVDLSVFYPTNKEKIREELDLPKDILVLLFSAHGIKRNIWKDFKTLRTALTLVADKLKGQSVLFLALGEESETEHIKDVTIKYVPHQKDPAVVARHYQAADIYLHAARADTFPNSVIEALACGTPVIATAVGGIPEQVKGLKVKNCYEGQYSENEATGLLVPAGDAESMAKGIELLLINDELRKQLSKNAAEDANIRFDLNRQVNDYLTWYIKILENKL